MMQEKNEVKQFGIWKDETTDFGVTSVGITFVPVIGYDGDTPLFPLSEAALWEIEMDKEDWISEGEEQPSDDYYHEKFYGELQELIDAKDLNEKYNEFLDHYSFFVEHEFRIGVGTSATPDLYARLVPSDNEESNYQFVVDGKKYEDLTEFYLK